MSGSVLIMFGKGEIVKVKKWFTDAALKSGGTTSTFIVPKSKYRKEEIDIYFEFKGNRLTIEYSIWDDIGGCFATFLGQELMKHFNVKKAGWDSVGYCTEDFKKDSGLLSWRYKELLEKEDLDRKVKDYMELEYKWRSEAEEIYAKEVKALFR